MQTYREYFINTKQNLYKSKKVKAPKPEIYVIYTGDRKTRPEEISLAEEFFGGADICIDARVKMIYDGKKGDIINQYVLFTKICSEQVAVYGRTRKAIQETIRICKDEDVLWEYLERREKEVVDIMAELFDQEEVFRSYVESERYDVEIATKMETAKRLLKMGKLSVEEIAAGSGLALEEVEELASLSLI